MISKYSESQPRLHFSSAFTSQLSHILVEKQQAERQLL